MPLEKSGHGSRESVDFPKMGLGGAGIANLYRAVSSEEAEATIHAALRCGFGLIDTAPFYGHGLSETRIGQALAHWSGPRPLVSSKVGRVLEAVPPGSEGDFGFVEPLPYRPRFDYSRDGVRRSLEGSLERLGIDKLDIALVHDIGARVHGRAHGERMRELFDETLPALNEARTEGLVERIGLGVNEWEVCVEILERTRLDVIMLAGRYTLLEQPALISGMLDCCVARGVRVLAAGVFNSGLLATKPSPESTYEYLAVPPDVLAKALDLWDACEAEGVPLAAAALQFPLLHPAIACVVVGARSVAEIEQQAAWRNVAIPGQLFEVLKRRGLVHPSAPTVG
ncbi:MAG TPA: aldo/keto reductase [Polyangiaceae bacterium]|nr:aldo/keto reductase [Polyangiaceae bacterium]